MQRHVRLLLSAVAMGAAFLVAFGASAASGQPAKRAITLDDLSKIKTVGDPQRSPDGKWVAYVVGSIDVEKDKRDSDLWMVSWDGAQTVRLTSGPESESSPRWSPDGRYLAFLASRGTEDEKKKGSQIWLLDRLGGEAQKLTEIDGGVSDYSWSPDSKKFVFTKGDKDPGRRAREDGGLEAEDRAAHRARPLSLQAGSRRLPEALLHARLRVRHRREEARTDHHRSVRRLVARLVAGRDEDRLCQHAPGAGPGSPSELGHLRRRREARRRAQAADDLCRRGRRASVVEPRRAVDRLPPGRRDEVQRLRDQQAHRHPVVRRRGEGPHRGPRPAGLRAHLVVPRREDADLRCRRRPRRIRRGAPRRPAAPSRS